MSRGGEIIITKSTVADNIATEEGGGILDLDDPNGRSGALVTLVNSTVTGNSAETGGGIQIHDRGSAFIVITNSTVTSNSARVEGGGIRGGGETDDGPHVTLTNTLVALNTAPTGPDLLGTFGARFSLIGDGTGGDVTNTDGNQVGNVSPNTGPIAPGLAPLSNNGGPTRTVALLAGSPAIDAGLAEECPGRISGASPGRRGRHAISGASSGKGPESGSVRLREGLRELRRNPGVVPQEGEICPDALTLAQCPEPFQQKRCDVTAPQVLPLGIGQRRLERPLVGLGWQLIGGGDGIGDQHAGPEAECKVGADRGGQLLYRVHPAVHGEPAGAAIERGKLVRPQAEHGHAERLQHFHRARQIQDRLGAGTYDGDRNARQGRQVRRHVTADAGVAMDATNAPRREYSDSVGVRGKHRGGDGGRPGPSSGDGGRQIAEVHLGDAGSRRKLVELGVGEPDAKGSPQNPDRGGCGTALSDFIFECQCGGDPVRMGEPVRDHRGLEGDDGPASGHGIGHLIGDDV